MDFEPKTEQQIRNEMCLPPGEYDFEVYSATEKTSSSGNAMIEMQLRIFTPDGSVRVMRDWLVAKMELKLNRFSRATGLEDVYQAGSMDSFSVEGATGKCVLTVKSSKQYGDQNAVKDYIPRSDVSTPYSEPEGVPASQTKAALQRDNGLDSEGIPLKDDCPF